MGSLLPSEGPPDAGPSVASQHGQADGELGQTDEALECDIPGWGVDGKDTGQLQDGHRHAQHPGQERDQDQPEGPAPSPHDTDGKNMMKPVSAARNAISAAPPSPGRLTAWS